MTAQYAPGRFVNARLGTSVSKSTEFNNERPTQGTMYFYVKYP